MSRKQKYSNKHFKLTILFKGGKKESFYGYRKEIKARVAKLLEARNPKLFQQRGEIPKIKIQKRLLTGGWGPKQQIWP